jgi:hypothetical protein
MRPVNGYASDIARFSVIERRIREVTLAFEALLYLCCPRLVNGYMLRCFPVDDSGNEDRHGPDTIPRRRRMRVPGRPSVRPPAPRALSPAPRLRPEIRRRPDLADAPAWGGRGRSGLSGNSEGVLV